MTSEVGQNGQVIIDEAIREQLGIEPGWVATQRVVNGHVEMTFVPPTRNRSLSGALRPHITRRPDPSLSWNEIREQAWEEAADDDQRLVEEWRARTGGA